MEQLFKKFTDLFVSIPEYVYYAEIDREQWIKQGSPSMKDFLMNHGASRLYGPDQERPAGCVGVEKGWKVIMRF